MGVGQKIPEGYKQTEVGVIPEGWQLVELETISGFITKGTTPTTYGFAWMNSGVLFLRSECVSKNGLDLTQAMYISEKAHQFCNRSQIENGDLLLTITGNVGRVVYYQLLEPANTNQHIARIRINTGRVYPKYVYHFLSQKLVRDFLSTIVTGLAYPQISLKQVRELKIPPPTPPRTKSHRQGPIAIPTASSNPWMPSSTRKKQSSREPCRNS
jgi:restriction endonuclease S subunit